MIIKRSLSTIIIIIIKVWSFALQINILIDLVDDSLCRLFFSYIQTCLESFDVLFVAFDYVRCWQVRHSLETDLIQLELQRPYHAF